MESPSVLTRIKRAFKSEEKEKENKVNVDSHMIEDLVIEISNGDDLCFKDFMNMACVCKRWYEVLQWKCRWGFLFADHDHLRHREYREQGKYLSFYIANFIFFNKVLAAEELLYIAYSTPDPSKSPFMSRDRANLVNMGLRSLNKYLAKKGSNSVVIIVGLTIAYSKVPIKIGGFEIIGAAPFRKSDIKWKRFFFSKKN